MSIALTTNDFRKRLAKHFYDGSVLPKLKYMAFGDGGHNDDGSVKEPSPDQTSLNHEILRKELSQIYQEDEYSVTGVGRIEKSECVGASISEAGLIDKDGNLVGMKNFAPKVKESDETYEIKIKLKF